MYMLKKENNYSITIIQSLIVKSWKILYSILKLFSTFIFVVWDDDGRSVRIGYKTLQICIVPNDWFSMLDAANVWILLFQVIL